jgi:hypothetical protein
MAVACNLKPEVCSLKPSYQSRAAEVEKKHLITAERE